MSGVSVQVSVRPLTPETISLINKETKEFTAEFAENAEEKNLDNLSVLCGEIPLGTISDFRKFHIKYQEGESLNPEH